MIINELIFEEPQIGDAIDLELGDTLLETVIEDLTDDGIVIRVDETALRMIMDSRKQFMTESEIKRVRKSEVEQTMSRLHQEYKAALAQGDKPKAEQIAKEIDEYSRERRAVVPDDWELEEAKYQGREVPLGKPMAGDVKKSKVYVKGPKGNVVKVNFGDKKMKIKKSNPKRRKSFRARHNCDNPGPRWKARYWSCRAW
jgi:hypothetical protein